MKPSQNSLFKADTRVRSVAENGILGLVHGLVSDQETVRRYLRTIETEVENLSQLINDLFELSQMEAGTLELHLESSSLTDLISDTLESMSAQATAGGRHLNLKGSVDGEVPSVVMDARRVQGCFTTWYKMPCVTRRPMALLYSGPGRRD
jgi:signal transduction histidine kinase